jgi:hypothetical protein
VKTLPVICSLSLACSALGFAGGQHHEVLTGGTVDSSPPATPAIDDSPFDVFPLHPGAQFSYDYYCNSIAGETVPFVLSVDSGLVGYVVFDSLHEDDTTILWHVEETRQLWHRRFDLFNHRDSLYWTNDSLVMLLSESTSGRHELTGEGLIWKFPFTSLPGDPNGGWNKPVCRFADSPGITVAVELGGPVYISSDSMLMSNTSGLIRTYQSYHWGQIDFSQSMQSAKLRGSILTGLQRESVPPRAAELLQNYPNPFNPSTTIRYALPQRSRTTLTVFNTLGQQVATLVNDTQEAGNHDVRFDGSGLASGVYFYRLTAGEYVNTKKLLVIK